VLHKHRKKKWNNFFKIFYLFAKKKTINKCRNSFKKNFLQLRITNVCEYKETDEMSQMFSKKFSKNEHKRERVTIKKSFLARNEATKKTKTKKKTMRYTSY